MVTATRVSRFDVAQVGRPTRTPQGFLRLPAFLTRAGVLEYRRADGAVVREYRPASEVFRAESLQTLASAPVTDLHPTEMVGPANVRKLSIGHVGELVEPKGHLVAASVTVQDATAIAAVERGDRRELSCGYKCRIDATPGEHEGQAYDVVQRDIVYNHVALGPRNWGRAGRDVALRVDSADADNDDEALFRLDSADDALGVLTIEPPPDRKDQGDDDMDLVTLRVDGIEVQVPKQSAQLIERGFTTRDETIRTLTGARDALQGKLDGAAGELTKAKEQLTAALDPKRLDQAVAERSALLDKARRVLPADHKFDGQTPRQIAEAVLKKLDSKIELSERSDEYVQARFDHVIETLPAGGNNGGDSGGGTRNDALARARRATHHGDAGGSSNARRDDTKYVPEWQQPLAVSRDR